MSLMPWRESFSVNIKSIDQRHKKLVTLLNDIHDATRAGRGKDAVETILGDLIKYTKEHFTAEEELMKKNAYPAYLQHKVEHDNFTKQVLAFQEEYKSGRVSVSIEIMQFLRDWLTDHILGVDRQYTSFLNTKGVH